MVDWDQVDRLRSKGWDWDRVAADPKVGFHADSDVGDSGRALRSLYYQRRSKGQRRPAKAEGGSGGKAADEERQSKWTLARIGWFLVPLLGIWFALAYAFPSPVGVYVPAIPLLGLLLAVAGFILAFGLLRTDDRWNRAARTTLIAGLVLGAVVAGMLGLVATLNGCPSLPPVSGGEPQGWEKANGPAWTQNGAPVLFFYGSVACPFCSAASWSIKMALDRFGTLSGTSYLSSKADDYAPHTPEVVLAGTSYQSQYLSFIALESTDDNNIVAPSPTSCVEQAYVAAYNPGGSVPFLVVNGQFIHVGATVEPASLGSGNPNPPYTGWVPLTPQEVQSQIDAKSGTAYDAIAPAAFLLEAFIVKTNGMQPGPVATDPNVVNYLNQIS